ncbi:MAG: N-acyl homoserine lactonase family protein [Peptococcaceae bacterium]|jgi:glyoxylase-like metal-dependent hydrolase (beta-lactamase superfamily II)|nr:N-acyl homoserine lactonase family protein [Peptococcaceae bacterium]
MSDIKLYVLANGLFTGPKHGIISCEDKSEMILTPMYSVLIQTPEGNILYDTALHDDPQRQAPFFLAGMEVKEEERLLNALAGIGVAPADIRYLVQSHLHTDHTGYIEKFPNAEVIVADGEFTHTMKDYALGVSKMGPDIAYWLTCGLKWQLIPDTEKTVHLVDGVTIYNFGSGHSYGMLGLLVELPKSGNKLVISDTIYTHENVGPPGVMPGIVQDIAGYLQTKEYVLNLAQEKKAEIWFGHDWDQYNNFKKSYDGCYD